MGSRAAGCKAINSGSPLILASASPRRRELLARLWPDFAVVPSDAPEDSPETEPGALALALAQRKAAAVAAGNPDARVLGSDTVVFLDGASLEKPRDEAENRAFLRRLSGRTHTVATAVCVLGGGQEHSGVERVAVTFRTLTEAERRHYAASGEGLDKAGGYGVQGLGMALVARIEGDPSAVVGLPLALTARLLRAAGLPVWGEGAG